AVDGGNDRGAAHVTRRGGPGRPPSRIYSTCLPRRQWADQPAPDPLAVVKQEKGDEQGEDEEGEELDEITCSGGQVANGLAAITLYPTDHGVLDLIELELAHPDTREFRPELMDGADHLLDQRR